MGKRWITDFSSDSVKQQSSPMTRIVFLCLRVKGLVII